MISRYVYLAAAILLAAALAATALGDEIIRKVKLRTPLTPKLQRVAEEIARGDPYFREAMLPFPPESEPAEQEEPRLYGAFVDLGEDGNALAIIYIGTAVFCGSAGCPLYIFRKEGGVWHDVGGGMSSLEIVYVLDRKDNGFHRIDIGDTDACFHGAPLTWNGREYVPENPCPDPRDRN